ncbi:Alpha/beta hydrolase fold-1 [Xylaria sp. FL1042]|nr:Alpha/beta hydrolase fold-1 [Xylaria sp. FL1042]
MATKPTILFIPGMFHTPWVFDDVRSNLSHHGYTTEVSNLASAGTAVAVAKEDLFSDASHIRSLLTNLIDEGKEIVVVAHSYGGLASSNAVQDLSVQKRSITGMQGGILMILYLSGIAIPAGQSLAEIADPTSLPWDYVGDGFVVPNNPRHKFYAGVEPSLVTKAVNALTPMSSQVLMGKSTYEPWNHGFEVGYIFTEDDNTLPIALQKTMYSQFPDGSFSASLASGHSPFLNLPDAVADVIRDGINHVLTKKQVPSI